jgi:hypothetical protein
MTAKWFSPRFKTLVLANFFLIIAYRNQRILCSATDNGRTDDQRTFVVFYI